MPASGACRRRRAVPSTSAYCDLDLPDYATACWGDNLARLMAVKQQYDPANLFHYAQSVSVSLPEV